MNYIYTASVAGRHVISRFEVHTVLNKVGTTLITIIKPLIARI